jgi:hypothetical protein
MLTRKQFVPPTLTGNWNVDGPNLLKAINDYWLALNGKSALEIDEARIRAAQGILFPATKVASSDANTLDDYNEVASSSPVVASGTGAITSYTSTLTETKIGNRVLFELTIAVTNNGTGATNIQVTMPDAAAAWRRCRRLSRVAVLHWALTSTAPRSSSTSTTAPTRLPGLRPSLSRVNIAFDPRDLAGRAAHPKDDVGEGKD